MSIKVRNAKKAGITVEVALAALLSVTVLFLVLGLFSQNLQVMAANSNINNLFKNSDRMTAHNGFNRDYASSQVNVQIVGEQGITAIHDQAKKAIDALAAKTTPLTDQEIASLAKYLTILAMSASGDPTHAIPKSYNDLMKNNGKISVNTNIYSPKLGYTSFSGKNVYWGSDMPNPAYDFTVTKPEDVKSRISNLSTIAGEKGFN